MFDELVFFAPNPADTNRNNEPLDYCKAYIILGKSDFKQVLDQDPNKKTSGQLD